MREEGSQIAGKQDKKYTKRHSHHHRSEELLLREHTLVVALSAFAKLPDENRAFVLLDCVSEVGVDGGHGVFGHTINNKDSMERRGARAVGTRPEYIRIVSHCLYGVPLGHVSKWGRQRFVNGSCTFFTASISILS